MWDLSELRETKVYQEASAEGALKASQTLILRQLTRRLGKMTLKVQAQVKALSLMQLEALSEALLDFSEIRDLKQWLELNS